MDALWVALIAIAIHRLWLAEQVFAGCRQWAARRLDRFPRLQKALTCPACFAFWAGIIALALWRFRAHGGLCYVAAALALYPVTRAAAWLAGAVGRYSEAAPPSPALTVAPPAAVLTPAAPSAPKQPCAPCAAAAAKTPPPNTDTPATEEVAPVADERPIVLLTSFSDFDPAYSLVTVVLEQARALVLAGFEVQIWVNQGANLKTYPRTMPIRVSVRPIMPTAHLVEDVVDEAGAARIQAALEAELQRARPLAVIDHDLLFVSWYVTHAAAIHRIKPIDGMRWLHQCHSAPSARHVTDSNRWRLTLPAGHEAVCVNYEDRLRLAEYYDVCVDRIVVLPNTRDLAWWARMSGIGLTMFRDFALGDADLVQIYPLCGTRMQSKGLEPVVRAFGALKAEFGHSVRLVITNANSAGAKVNEEVERYLQIAHDVGLTTVEADGVPVEIVFTSRRYPDLAGGVPGSVVSELFLASNLFVFPSVSEAGPLVLMEAALAGCLLVLNRDVPAMADIVPHDQALWFGFGNARGATLKADPVDVAGAIDAAFRQSPSLRSKRTVLRQRSLRALADTFTTVFRRSVSGPGG